MKYGGEGSNEFNKGYEQCQEDIKLRIEMLENVVYHDCYHSLATVHQAKIDLAKLKEGL